MAGVFSFGKDVLKDEDQPKGAKAIAQLEKALKGKKVPPRQTRPNAR